MNEHINVNEMKAILQGMIFVSETPVTMRQMLTKINAVYKKQQCASSATATTAVDAEVSDDGDVCVAANTNTASVQAILNADEQTVTVSLQEAAWSVLQDEAAAIVGERADATDVVPAESVNVDAIHDDEDDTQALANTDLPITVALVKSWIKELQEDYQNPQHGFELVYVAKGYQFRTKIDVAIALNSDKKTMPSRLSASALETLAIVAYEQPVARSKVDDVRGVDSGGVLKTLLEKEFLRIVGRADEPGQPLLYGTTSKFLEVFNLKSLKDMPSLAEIKDLYLKADEDMGDEPAQYFDPEEVLEQRVNAMTEEEIELMGELDASLNSLKEVEHSIDMFHAPKAEVVVDVDDGTDSSVQ